jgi:hypothetical protein
MLGTRISGTHTVRLPGKVRKVVDLYTGKTVGENTDKITVTAVGWTTRLWKIEK